MADQDTEPLLTDQDDQSPPTPDPVRENPQGTWSDTAAAAAVLLLLQESFPSKGETDHAAPPRMAAAHPHTAIEGNQDTDLPGTSQPAPHGLPAQASDCSYPFTSTAAFGSPQFLISPDFSPPSQHHSFFVHSAPSTQSATLIQPPTFTQPASFCGPGPYAQPGLPAAQPPSPTPPPALVQLASLDQPPSQAAAALPCPLMMPPQTASFPAVPYSSSAGGLPAYSHTLYYPLSSTAPSSAYFSTTPYTTPYPTDLPAFSTSLSGPTVFQAPPESFPPAGPLSSGFGEAIGPPLHPYATLSGLSTLSERSEQEDSEYPGRSSAEQPPPSYRRDKVPEETSEAEPGGDSEEAPKSGGAAAAAAAAGAEVRRRLGKKAWIILGPMLLVSLASFSSISIMAPFFPKLVAERGLSKTTDGFIFCVYSLVMVIFSPILGKVLPLMNLWTVYLVGIVITAVAEICFGMVVFLYDPVSFVVAAVTLRALAAFGTACFFTVIYALIPVLFPDDTNTINGMLETAIGLGMCVGPAIGVWLYSLGGFCLPFYCLSCFILASLFANFYTFPKDEVRIVSNHGMGQVWAVLGQSGAILSLVILCSSAVCVAVLYPTLQPHMSKLGVSVEGVGMVYLLLSAVYAVSSPLVGLATDRYGGLSAFMLAGLLLTFVSFLLIGNSPLLPHLSHDKMYVQDVVGIVLLGLACSMCIVPTYGAILQAAARSGQDVDMGTYGIIGGLWSATYSLGEVLGPMYAGMMAEHVSFDTTTTITAILPLSLAIVQGAHMCATHFQPKKKRTDLSSSGDVP